MNQKVRVIRSYTASYDDPIRVTSGAQLKLSGRSDNWQGHIRLWARAEDGREGWVPDNLVEQHKIGSCLAKFDYSAIELSCVTGEVLTKVQSSHGWTRCKNGQGDAGWVPDLNLQAL